MNPAYIPHTTGADFYDSYYRRFISSYSIPPEAAAQLANNYTYGQTGYIPFPSVGPTLHTTPSQPGSTAGLQEFPASGAIPRSVTSQLASINPYHNSMYLNSIMAPSNQVEPARQIRNNNAFVQDQRYTGTFIPNSAPFGEPYEIPMRFAPRTPASYLSRPSPLVRQSEPPRGERSSDAEDFFAFTSPDTAPAPTTGFTAPDAPIAANPSRPVLHPLHAPAHENGDGLFNLGNAPGDFFVPRAFTLPPPQRALGVVCSGQKCEADSEVNEEHDAKVAAQKCVQEDKYPRRIQLSDGEAGHMTPKAMVEPETKINMNAESREQVAQQSCDKEIAPTNEGLPERLKKSRRKRVERRVEALFNRRIESELYETLGNIAYRWSTKDYFKRGSSGLPGPHLSSKEEGHADEYATPCSTCSEFHQSYKAELPAREDKIDYILGRSAPGLYPVETPQPGLCLGIPPTFSPLSKPIETSTRERVYEPNSNESFSQGPFAARESRFTSSNIDIIRDLQVEAQNHYNLRLSLDPIEKGPLFRSSWRPSAFAPLHAPRSELPGRVDADGLFSCGGYCACESSEPLPRYDEGVLRSTTPQYDVSEDCWLRRSSSSTPPPEYYDEDGYVAEHEWTEHYGEDGYEAEHEWTEHYDEDGYDEDGYEAEHEWSEFSSESDGSDGAGGLTKRDRALGYFYAEEMKDDAVEISVKDVEADAEEDWDDCDVKMGPKLEILHHSCVRVMGDDGVEVIYRY